MHEHDDEASLERNQSRAAPMEVDGDGAPTVGDVGVGAGFGKVISVTITCSNTCHNIIAYVLDESNVHC
jgi:hypothetical protein